MLLDKTAWLAAVWPTVNPGTQESSHCSLTWDQALNEQPWWVVSESVRTLGVGQRARPCIKGPAGMISQSCDARLSKRNRPDFPATTMS
jgi:hypothetical protein